jgi:predicted transcriptional regulator
MANPRKGNPAMKTTLEFISDLKTKTGLDSDYAIAKHLGITKTALSQYRLGKSFLGDQTAMKVAEMLEIDPAYVVACVHAERTKHAAEKKLWERIATLTAGIAATLLMVTALPFITLPTDPMPMHSAFDNSQNYASQNIHYAYLGICCFFLFVIALLAIPKKKHKDDAKSD